MITSTQRQRDCLEFIRAYQAKRGFGPSYREIMAGIGMSSKSGIHRVINGLETRGLLRPTGGKMHRCYHIPEPEHPCRDGNAQAHLLAILRQIRKAGHIKAHDRAVMSAVRFARAA